MNALDKSRIYTKFVIHPTDSSDTQTEMNTINQAQVDSVPLAQSDFKTQVLFNMGSTVALNECFIDDYSTTQYTTVKTNTLYDSNAQCFSVGTNANSNLLVSTPIQSEIGNNAFLNDFVLMADEVKPVGSNISYFIMDDNNEEFPITLNSVNKPFHFLNNVHNVTIKMVMTNNSIGESPRVYGLGVLFFDITLEGTYGLFNPDLSNLDITTTGTLFLVRDNTQGDKLVQVYDAETVTNLTYDGDQLMEIKSLDGADLTDTVLEYGPYVDSTGATDQVLLAITTTENTNETTESGV
jgi:hypothetical protein